MIEQILSKKLANYYEAMGRGDFISSTLSFFDMINIISVMQNKKANQEFNKNWKLLHGELFSETFEKVKKDLTPDTIKKQFNTDFKLIYETDKTVIEIKKNIKEAISQSLPLLVKTLNIKPVKETEITEGFAGDIGYEEF
jgi:hypothetical protein